MSKSMIRVLCVDDHSFLIEGLRARFELEGDIECVGSLPDAQELIPRAKQLSPHVVLLDIEMPGPDPFDSAAELKRQCPEIRTVILSAFVRDHYISAAMRAGTWGYFSKSDSARAIVDGIRKVASGEFAFSPAVQERCQPTKDGRTDRLKPPKSRIESLTAREQEVLRMIGRGKSRNEIAEALVRSPKTIDGHRESIMQKLDIHDRGELVRFAIREGLVEA